MKLRAGLLLVVATLGLRASAQESAAPPPIEGRVVGFTWTQVGDKQPAVSYALAIETNTGIRLALGGAPHSAPYRFHMVALLDAAARRQSQIRITHWCYDPPVGGAPKGWPLGPARIAKAEVEGYTLQVPYSIGCF